MPPLSAAFRTSEIAQSTTRISKANNKLIVSSIDDWLLGLLQLQPVLVRMVKRFVNNNRCAMQSVQIGTRIRFHSVVQCPMHADLKVMSQY